MKHILFLILAGSIILSACDSFVRQNPAKDHPPFTVNENGDTVKITYRDDGSVLSEITVKDG